LPAAAASIVFITTRKSAADAWREPVYTTRGLASDGGGAASSHSQPDQ